MKHTLNTFSHKMLYSQHLKCIPNEMKDKYASDKICKHV